jgi:hypothetical protein
MTIASDLGRVMGIAPDIGEGFELRGVVDMDDRKANLNSIQRTPWLQFDKTGKVPFR